MISVRKVENITSESGWRNLLETTTTVGISSKDLHGDRDRPSSFCGEQWDCYLFDCDPQLFSAGRAFMGSNDWWLRYHEISGLYAFTTVACTGYALTQTLMRMRPR